MQKDEKRIRQKYEKEIHTHLNIAYCKYERNKKNKIMQNTENKWNIKCWDPFHFTLWNTQTYYTENIFIYDIKIRQFPKNRQNNVFFFAQKKNLGILTKMAKKIVGRPHLRIHFSVVFTVSPNTFVEENIYLLSILKIR